MKIKVFCTTYAVKRERPVGDGMGEIDHVAQRILIHPDLDGDVLGLTLWHEILHAIEYHSGLDLGEDRAAKNDLPNPLDILAMGIYSVLKDNKEMRGNEN